jgi:hypothetical protein
MERSFCASAAACQALSNHLRQGLQALQRRDRERVRARYARRIVGSVSLDNALAESHPNEPRWDYGVGYQPTKNGDDVVHWIEVHPATDAEIRFVQAKLAWLKAFLSRNALALAALERRFVWVSSGKTRLTPTAPALRRLAEEGCRHVGRVYQIA